MLCVVGWEGEGEEFKHWECSEQRNVVCAKRCLAAGAKNHLIYFHNARECLAAAYLARASRLGSFCIFVVFECLMLC